VLWFSKRRRRASLIEAPLDAEERALLERHVRYYRYLPADQRAELEPLIRVFLAEKRFEGCGGLELTDAMRLVIAAHACILLLGRGGDVYPLLQSVLVYPSAFLVEEPELHPDGTLEPGLMNASASRGSADRSCSRGTRSHAAERPTAVNVAFHEFAHQLDDEEGVADGAPALGTPMRVRHGRASSVERTRSTLPTSTAARRRFSTSTEPRARPSSSRSRPSVSSSAVER
jgi:Mlc titration factor MtfA (ptsG expression regulator)